jgi:hypothetical protein
MNQFKYRWVLYFISGVILTTLCIQVYWNYKNYQLGKQQLINDVQTSLDHTVDQYYAQLATGESIEFMKDSIEIDLRHSGSLNSKNDSIRIFINDSNKEFSSQSIVRDEFSTGITMIKAQVEDSITSVFVIKDSLNGTLHSDSIRTYFEKLSEPIEWLSSKIILSLSENSLSLYKIDSLFKLELERKNISIDYGLSYNGPFNKSQELRSDIIEKAKLQTVSTSPFFIDRSSLKVHFSNIMITVLKKNVFGIFLSFILISAVIGCLLYLLGIIRRQKQLAEVKNDLISNITHEFKTPIATIGAAMEGIQAFNSENDSVKNLRYARISSEQVEKLNGMVEKLLETATLDSEDLNLQFETINLVELLRKAATKETIALKDKVIQFEASEEEIIGQVDIFHFENAINNCIDNAIKYGGNKISVAIKNDKNSIEISISDTGTSLSEEHKQQIFEKFYRVPKGNTHDVKGFGIGLYYSKKIIEKHQGTITLETNGNTTFKIHLPNA